MWGVNCPLYFIPKDLHALTLLILNVAVECLALLLRIREAMDP
jgi:hypothetical protein